MIEEIIKIDCVCFDISTFIHCIFTGKVISLKSWHYRYEYLSALITYSWIHDDQSGQS